MKRTGKYSTSFLFERDSIELVLFIAKHLVGKFIWTQTIVLIESDFGGRLKRWVSVFYHCNVHVYQVYRGLKAGTYSTVGRMSFTYISMHWNIPRWYWIPCSSHNGLAVPIPRPFSFPCCIPGMLLSQIFTRFPLNIIQFCLNITFLGKHSLAILPMFIPPLYHHFSVWFCFTFLHST